MNEWINQSVTVGSGDNRASTQLSFTHVTSNTWAHSEVFGFFRKFFLMKKCIPPGQITFWKYNGKSIFFTFLNTDRNASKKNFRIETWTFLFQICFKNQFLTSESGQTENTRIREYVYFQFDHFPKSKIDF